MSRYSNLSARIISVVNYVTAVNAAVAASKRITGASEAVTAAAIAKHMREASEAAAAENEAALDYVKAKADLRTAFAAYVGARKQSDRSTPYAYDLYKTARKAAENSTAAAATVDAAYNRWLRVSEMPFVHPEN
jgi:flagellar biosynthesis GTPase FlhF